MNKLICYSAIIDDFDILKGAGILSDERIVEIKSLIAPESFTEVKLASGTILKEWRLHILSGKMYHEINFKDKWGRGYVAKQVLDDLLTQEEIEKINKRADGVYTRQKEEKLFEKAEKINSKEYEGSVFKDGCGYNEGYFGNISEYLEWEDDFARENDSQWNGGPTYLWAAESRPVCHLNLERIMERATEDSYEDFDINSLKGIKELQEAIDKFNKLNEDHVVYEQDTRKAILL